MTGWVSMLGILRWAGRGGSYRTTQHFFATALPWAMLFWVLFREHLHRPDDVYLLAGDEGVVSLQWQVSNGGRYRPWYANYCCEYRFHDILLKTRVRCHHLTLPVEPV